MAEAGHLVSISASAASAPLAYAVKEGLTAEGFRVLLDVASVTQAINWGIDETQAIDSIFDLEAIYCILLLDRSYSSEKWFHHRRAHLLDTVARRPGFILPVQVGSEIIDIHGLTTLLGKLQVSADEPQKIIDCFLEKFGEKGSHTSDIASLPKKFKRIIRLYNKHVELNDIAQDRRLGFEIISSKDRVTEAQSFFLTFAAGAPIKPATEEIRIKYGSLLRGKANIVLLPKERGQRDLGRRIKNVTTTLNTAAIPTKQVMYLDDFTWQYCKPQYLQKPFEEFAISGFVEPTVDVPEAESAIDFVSDWFNNQPTPILVVRGSGGVGKTTLMQSFANKVIAPLKKTVFFIDDEAICDHYLRSTDAHRPAFSIYDAYLAFLAKCGETDGSTRLSQEEFELYLDGGHLFIIIDGLDQVISRLGGGFPIEHFMSSMYAEDSLQRRKVAITCRAAFLPDSYFSPQVTTIDVLPFDTNQARAFLDKRFPELPLITQKGIRLACSLTRTSEGADFYPFLLDIVANLLRSQIENSSRELDEDTFQEKELDEIRVLSAENDNDWVVFRVCAREKRKYPDGLTPAQQVNAFLSLSVQHHGIIRTEDLTDFFKTELGVTADAAIKGAFVAHPFIQTNQHSISFKYDVIREHFRNVFVSHLFVSNASLGAEAVALLAERNKFASDLLKSSADRLTIPLEDAKLRAINMIDQLNVATKGGNELQNSRAKTTILLIVLQLENLLANVDREGATSVLNDLYGAAGQLSNVALVDVRDKIEFDFRSLRLENCSISSYDYFWDCTFGPTTMFVNCKLMMLPKRERLRTSASRRNFDFNTCSVDQSVIISLAEQEELGKAVRSTRRTDLNSLFKLFLQGGYLRPKREAELKSRYRGKLPVLDLLGTLRESDVVEPYTNENVTLGAQWAICTSLRTDVIKFVQEDHLTEELKRRIKKLL